MLKVIVIVGKWIFLLLRVLENVMNDIFVLIDGLKSILFK